MKKISKSKIEKFRIYLTAEEKSVSTINKYVRDVKTFAEWHIAENISKQTVLQYKEYLRCNYSAASVNSIISSLNSFFEFISMPELKMKTIKIHKRIFVEKEKELTKAEYEKLLKIALKTGNERLYYVMQTICSTGIRVSELKYITVEAIASEQAKIFCKGKERYIFLPTELCEILKNYAEENETESGLVFITRTGSPLDRSNIWTEMKKLCKMAEISEDKVFPHNLRHLFARTYYSCRKDIVRLADVLGHSNVNTTRIYTMEAGEIHRRQMQNLGLCLNNATH